MASIVEFSEVFTNEEFEYGRPNENVKNLALAEGLNGWAMCMSGNKPPKNFGIGMVKIGRVLDIELDRKGPTAENLMALAKKMEG